MSATILTPREELVRLWAWIEACEVTVRELRDKTLHPTRHIAEKACREYCRWSAMLSQARACAGTLAAMIQARIMLGNCE
jgi:hypothetical protein